MYLIFLSQRLKIVYDPLDATFQQHNIKVDQQPDSTPRKLQIRCELRGDCAVQNALTYIEKVRARNTLVLVQIGNLAEAGGTLRYREKACS